MLIHCRISGRGGNCRVFDSTTVLTVPSTSIEKQLQSYDISLYRKYNLDFSQHQVHNHDYDLISNFVELTEVSSNIVTYISGYVLKMLQRTVKCIDCLEGSSTTSERVKGNSSYKLIFKKNWGTSGGLYIPSAGVTSICLVVEKYIRKIVNYTDYKLPQDEGFLPLFTIAVAQQFYTQIEVLFPNLKDPFLETPPIQQNHGFILVKEIINAYTRIRFFNLAKKYTTVLQGTLVRRELNKLILFNHQ